MTNLEWRPVPHLSSLFDMFNSTVKEHPNRPAIGTYWLRKDVWMWSLQKVQRVRIFKRDRSRAYLTESSMTHHSVLEKVFCWETLLFMKPFTECNSLEYTQKTDMNGSWWIGHVSSSALLLCPYMTLLGKRIWRIA